MDHRKHPRERLAELIVFFKRKCFEMTVEIPQDVLDKITTAETSLQAANQADALVTTAASAVATAQGGLTGAQTSAAAAHTQAATDATAALTAVKALLNVTG